MKDNDIKELDCWLQNNAEDLYAYGLDISVLKPLILEVQRNRELVLEAYRVGKMMGRNEKQ